MRQSELEITITTFNRMNYLKQSLESLESLNLPYKVHIIDDCSQMPTRQFLEKITAKNGWKLHLNKHNLGDMYNNLTRGNYVKSKYMYITDSDMVYRSDLNQSLEEAIDFVDKGHCVSLYNSTLHEEGEMVDDKYMYKNTIGGCSVLISMDMWNDFINDKRKNLIHGWDFGLCYWIRDNNKPLFVCRQQSSVDHIGEDGVHCRIGGTKDISRT